MRRIYGLEHEYGVAGGSDDLQPSVAERLIRPLARRMRTTALDLSTFLDNGGRAYVDTGAHPEYATPECATALEALRYASAGDLLIERLRCEVAAELAADGYDAPLHVLKNNLDTQGTTYGCHENYLLPRVVPMPFAAALLVPFLVTRQVFAGAGTIVAADRDAHGRARAAEFAMSQRAGPTEIVVGTCTTQQRPILNSRDEPHAEARRYRRLHLIIGDANMNQVAAYLKVATTGLVLDLVEWLAPRVVDEVAGSPTWWPAAPSTSTSGAIDVDRVRLTDPVGALKAISADLSCRTTVPLADGGRASALDVQWWYVEQIDRCLTATGDDRERRQAFNLWVEVLGLLEADPMLAHQEVDWVTKRRLLDLLGGRHGFDVHDAEAARLDLLYHDISPEGVHGRLVRRGMVRRLLSADEIASAIDVPPQETRARLRSSIIRRARDLGLGVAADWTLCKVTTHGGDAHVIPLMDPFLAVDRDGLRALDSLAA